MLIIIFTIRYTEVHHYLYYYYNLNELHFFPNKYYCYSQKGADYAEDSPTSGGKKQQHIVLGFSQEQLNIIFNCQSKATKHYF